MEKKSQSLQQRTTFWSSSLVIIVVLGWRLVSALHYMMKLWQMVKLSATEVLSNALFPFPIVCICLVEPGG